MKLAIGHLINFAAMFVVCFVTVSLGLAAIPVLAAFVFWDLAPLSLGWDTTFFWARLIAVLSAVMGVMFTFSKEGQGVAKHYEETGEW